MKQRLAAYFILITVLFSLNACKDAPSKSHGPIVLGDSSTIVTERDPQKLEDLVTDLHPDIQPSASSDTVTATKDTVTAAHTDTAKKTPVASAAPPAQPLSGNGLKADFGATSVLIANITAKQPGNRNLLHANGAVYTLANGNINGSTMKVTGNITKVSMRYQAAIMLKDDDVQFLVDGLSSTTDWHELKGGNGIYRITDLDPAHMEYTDDGPAAIRNAVSKAARRHRVRRKDEQDVLSDLRSVKKANQKPLYVVLRSVMLKIDGKDEKGRSFSKQVRIDMPI